MALQTGNASDPRRDPYEKHTLYYVERLVKGIEKTLAL